MAFQAVLDGSAVKKCTKGQLRIHASLLALLTLTPPVKKQAQSEQEQDHALPGD